jgi:ribosomal-protein-serine acetyltransferase
VSDRLPERIEGGGLLLRRWLVADAEAQEQAIAESADHLRPWMAWMADEPLTLEDRRAMIAGWDREWRGGGDAFLGVFAEGRVAGNCGLHRRRGPDTLEIGYWIHSAFLGRRLAGVVARLLTSAAFDVPGIRHVDIHHDKANAASAQVPRRLGFRFLGELPDGKAAPAELGIDCTWRIEREEWKRALDH